jgi:hypothetical protein
LSHTTMDSISVMTTSIKLKRVATHSFLTKRTPGKPRRIHRRQTPKQVVDPCGINEKIGAGSSGPKAQILRLRRHPNHIRRPACVLKLSISSGENFLVVNSITELGTPLRTRPQQKKTIMLIATCKTSLTDS